MKKFPFIIWLIFSFFSCDSEDAPACIQTAGEIVSEEIEVAAFEEINVFDDVKLFIQQGSEHKVVVETGKNILSGVSVEVLDNRLHIRNEKSCNYLRDYGLTKVTVTTPTLSWLQNSSHQPIESMGVLNFPEIWLRSLNQERDPNVYTNGDFILKLEVNSLRITNDNVSNYFLSGKADRMDLFFAAGDGRLEAGDLVTGHIDLMHRGTNKLIVNPQESIKGDIFGFGDVIAKNRPSEVRVKEHYTGRLIFE
ncbi:head GIN domain-containing protein [Salegentibacter sediminis]|uniref:head GIN domain-containing protein n=1 Tax=Salegentibacter sediminis TaxID=1930251 RepID=UPI0009C08B9F|nr:head GIN domain-containing protein [Salegentibacter sediminis]